MSEIFVTSSAPIALFLHPFQFLNEVLGEFMPSPNIQIWEEIRAS